MAQININIEMNENLARRFEDTCDAIGLDMDEAFNIFAQKVVNEKGIPFEVKEEDYPNDNDKLAKVKKWLACAGIVVSITAVIAAIASLCRPKKHRR